MLYRMKGDVAEVVAMFHTLEDYENEILRREADSRGHVSEYSNSSWMCDMVS